VTQESEISEGRHSSNVPPHGDLWQAHGQTPEQVCEVHNLWGKFAKEVSEDALYLRIGVAVGKGLVRITRIVDLDHINAVTLTAFDRIPRPRAVAAGREH
jgi:hypothetical protein